MTLSPAEPSAPDLAAVWASARLLRPIYAEMAREFAIDLPLCPALEAGEETPESESVDAAKTWLNAMDERVQVHQLRQFLQTSSVVDGPGMVALLQHFLAKTERTDAVRDKIDFLLVQYFSQSAPTDVDDNAVDIAYVAQGLEPILGKPDLKSPVWLNALDRVVDAARRCRSLDELLHGGVLEQGRKAKAQAGDLFYLPVALISFTRFGYLMRRVFFRLMLTDLNHILDGLTALEEKGVETIDCRRAQFSAQEPILRLRMICQSWKVMFQAEYSSGQPLRMLVDLRASVEAALEPASGSDISSGTENDEVAGRSASAAAAGQSASASVAASAKVEASSLDAVSQATGDSSVANTAVAEFEVAAASPEWNPDADAQPGNNKYK
jgi:hypothetical protein